MKQCEHTRMVAVPTYPLAQPPEHDRDKGARLMCMNPKCGWAQNAPDYTHIGQIQERGLGGLYHALGAGKELAELAFFIAGTPAPQGSKRAFVIPGPKARAVIVENSKAVKPWRQAVSNSAWQAANDADWKKIDAAAAMVRIVFWLQAPASGKRQLPSVKPDGDKLLRSTLDGITDAGNVVSDDARITDFHVMKRYAVAGMMLGAHITIYRLED